MKMIMAIIKPFKLDEVREALSGRGEYLTDDDGLITGSANKLKELTVALNYTPVAHLKLSAELRQDKADNPLFANGATTTTKQNSFELMAAYSF